MRDRFLIRASLQGIVGCVEEILHRAPGIAATREVHRQLRGNLLRMPCIASYLAHADLLMQVHPAPGRYARVDHLVINRVLELVTRRRRAVGPGLDPIGPNERSLSGEYCVAPFNPLDGLGDRRRNRSNGKGAPRNTRGVQQHLVLFGQAIEVLLDVRAQVRWQDVAERCSVFPSAVGLAGPLEKLLVHQLVDHGDEEQRVSSRAAEDKLRRACRNGDGASLVQISSDRGCRQPFQHQLHTLCVRPQIGEEGAQRMCAP